MRKRTKEAISKALTEGSSDELRDLLFQEWEEAPQAIDIMTWIALFEFRAGKIVSFKRYASLVLRGVDEKWTRQDATLENTYERVPALYVLEGLMEANLMYGNYEEAYTLAMQLIGEGRTSDSVIRTSILSRYHMEGLKRALVVADVFIEQLHQGGLENIEESVYLAKATAFFQEAQRVLTEKDQGPGPFLAEETEDIEAFGTQEPSEEAQEDSYQSQGKELALMEEEGRLDKARAYLLDAIDALGEFQGEPGEESRQLREKILDELEKICQNLPQEEQSEKEPDFGRVCEAGEATNKGLEPSQQIGAEFLEEPESLAPESQEVLEEEGDEKESQVPTGQAQAPEEPSEEENPEMGQRELLQRCIKLLKENGRLKEAEKPQELYIQVPLQLDEEGEKELLEQAEEAAQAVEIEQVLEEAQSEPLPELEEAIEVAGEGTQEAEAESEGEGDLLEEPSREEQVPPLNQGTIKEEEAKEPSQEIAQDSSQEEPMEAASYSLEEKLDFIQSFAKIILEGTDHEQEAAYGATYAVFYLELRPYLANPLQLRAAFIKLLMQDCPELLYAQGGCIRSEEFLGAWKEVFSQVQEENRGAFLDTSLSRVFDNWVAEWSAAQVKESAENTNWKKVQLYMQEALEKGR